MPRDWASVSHYTRVKVNKLSATEQVKCTILNNICLEKYCDLETWFSDHSRTPFDRLHRSSFWKLSCRWWYPSNCHNVLHCQKLESLEYCENHMIACADGWTQRYLLLCLAELMCSKNFNQIATKCIKFQNFVCARPSRSF